MALSVEGYGLLPVVEVPPALLSAFSCGKPHLDEFLCQAAQFHRSRLGLTSVVFHRDFVGVIGYFTLANDALPLTTSEQYEFGVETALKAYPAVKLGRLAVSTELQGQGVGRHVMGLVHGEILESLSLSAARLIIVDADNDPPVVQFYRNLGYQDSLWAEAQAKNHGPSRRNLAEPSTIKMVRDVLSP